MKVGLSRQSLPAIVIGLTILGFAGGLLYRYPSVQALIGHSVGNAVSGDTGHYLHQPFELSGGSLKLHLRFDGDVKDSSGNGNDGSATDLTSTTGMYGSAYTFNGTSSFVQGNNINSTLGNGDFTITAWAKETNVGRVAIFSKEDDITRSIVMDAGGDIGCEVYDGTHNPNLSGGGGLNDGGWHFFVCQRTGGNLVVYADNIQVNSTVDNSTDNSCSGCNYRIGRRTYSGAAGSYFHGTIDDVRVYERALSATEMTTLYKATQPPEIDQSLKGYWKFDESSGSTAADSSGNGNNASINNFSGISFRTGMFGEGFWFWNLASSSVSLSDATKYQDIGSNYTNGVTFELWFNAKSLGDNSGNGVLIDKITAGNAGWKIHVTTNNALEFTQAYATTNLDVITSANVFDFDTWNHLALTWDSSQTASHVHIFLNGREVSYATQTNGSGALSSDGAQPLMIGNTVNTHENFDGTIDDVRIYNRVLPTYTIAEQSRAGMSLLTGRAAP